MYAKHCVKLVLSEISCPLMLMNIFLLCIIGNLTVFLFENGTFHR